MDKPQPQPGAGGAPNAPDAAPTQAAGGPAEKLPGAAEPQTVGTHPRAAPSRGGHAVVSAPLWPRLCERDPEMPAARMFVHLVAEGTRVRAADVHLSLFLTCRG